MPTQSRQLAAIMFTDIVGYTALMDEDEQKAFELLKKNRQVQRPIIEKYNGKWLKEMGDGVLASFSTVTDAVFCAAAIQKTCEDEPDLNLRIGIHQGEVVFEGEDVFGSGVNIASRIEALASPGEIWVSESVHQNIKNKVGIHSKFVKEEKLKNVQESVSLYKLEISSSKIEELIDHLEPRANGSKVIDTWLKHRVIFFTLMLLLIVIGVWYIQSIFFSGSTGQIGEVNKSIAVLPFKNLISEEENQYFADGVMQAIYSNLSKVGELNVVSQLSVEQFKGSTKPATEIAKELGVVYLLTGSAQKYGDQVRVTVQLINASKDKHLWSETYDRELTDLFKLQSEIAMEVLGHLESRLTTAEKRLIDNKPTTNLESYLIYLKGTENHKLYDQSLSDTYLDEALKHYNQAIKKDSLFALAYTAAARAIWDRDYDDNFYSQNVVDTVKGLCERALRINVDLAEAYYIRAMCHRANSQFANHKSDLLRTIELNPNHSYAYLKLGEHSFRIEGLYENSIEYLKEALFRSHGEELAEIFNQYCWLYLEVGMFEKAIYYGLKEKDIRNWSVSLFWTFMHQGNFNHALAEANEYQSLYPQRIQGLWHLAVSNLYLERLNESEKYFDQLLHLFGTEGKDHRLNRYRHRLGYLLWRSGKEKVALEHFQISIKYLESGNELNRYRARDNNAYNLAAIASFLGNKEEAYFWLEKMNKYGWHWGYPYHINNDPMFAPLKEEKKFQDIVDKALNEKSKIRTQLLKLEAVS
jgi:adenylate cyclase